MFFSRGVSRPADPNPPPPPGHEVPHEPVLVHPPLPHAEVAPDELDAPFPANLKLGNIDLPESNFWANSSILLDLAYDDPWSLDRREGCLGPEFKL